MKKLFYKDKVINFNTKYNSIDKKNIIFSDNFIITDVLEHLRQTNELTIICSDIDLCFNNFAQSFKRVTAAGGAVFNENNELLFIYRNGVWDLPKGKVELGESIEEGAIREVEEETSLLGVEITGAPIITHHIYDIYGCWELKETYWYKMRYSGDRRSDNLAMMIKEGITKIAWIPQNKVHEVAEGSFAMIKSVVSNYIK